VKKLRWSLEELIYGIKIASNRDYKFWYRLIRFPKAFLRIINVIIKWVFTGYCWATVWSLDHYLIDIFIIKLKQFKKLKKSGYPSELNNQQEWDAIIDRLIHGFEIMKSEEYGLDYEQGEMIITDNGSGLGTISFEQTPEEEEQMSLAWKKQLNYDEETMNLFNKYFRHLWD
jgi:hypothetical protein